MHAATSTARAVRAHHRHDLRTLTYVTLDEANGGIIRNLSHEGVAVQAVGALRPQQFVRLRFELRQPRLRVEARGEVMWANPSGQCGIRFLDLPPRMVRQLNEWIFGDLLESIPRHSGWLHSPFAPASADFGSVVEDDGLILSPVPQNVIQLEPPELRVSSARDATVAEDNSVLPSFEPEWLSRPLSGRSLAWTIDSLIVVAGLLLFSLVFLSVTHELPRWPLSLETACGAAIFVAVFYLGFFYAFAGASLGTKLSRVAGSNLEDEAGRDAARFR